MTKRRYLLISGVPLALLLLVLALSPGAGLPQPVAAGPNAIPGRYIVVLKDNANSEATVSSLEQSVDVVPDVVYTSALHGFAAEMSDAQARALARDPSVALVEPDQTMSVDLHNNLFQTVPTGVDRIDADQNSTAHITNAPNGTALDIDIAVIDTGVDTQHPDLNVAGGMGFTGANCSNHAYEDDFGHGTHVAGTIAARDDDRGAVGVAPGARIWAVKVLDSSGSGSNSCVIAGIDWVTDRRAEFNDGPGDGDPGIDIRVANMSLGGDSTGITPAQDATCSAIDAAAGVGVIFAVAAGNSASNASNFSPAHCLSPITVSAFADFDGKPGGLCNGGACLPAYLACQGCFSNTFSSCPQGNQTVYDDTFACFSNYGAVVDIAAPGVDIISTYPPLNGACGGAPCYAVMSGTSMATPHVAGALALFVLATNYSGSAQGPAVMTAFTAAGYTRAQNSVCGFTGDPDSTHEPVLYVGNSCGQTSTPSPTASPSPTPSPTPTHSPSPTPTHSPSPTPTLSPSPTPTHSPSPTPTHSPSPTPTHSPSPTPTHSPTPTPSPTPSPTPTHSPTPTPTPTPSPAPTPTHSPTPTPTPVPVHIQGDANCDDSVTAFDALQILLALGDLSSSSTCAGAPDVNCNGHLDGQDVLIILQYLSGHAMSVAQCPRVGSNI